MTIHYTWNTRSVDDTDPIDINEGEKKSPCRDNRIPIRPFTPSRPVEVGRENKTSRLYDTGVLGTIRMTVRNRRKRILRCEVAGSLVEVVHSIPQCITASEWTRKPVALLVFLASPISQIRRTRKRIRRKKSTQCHVLSQIQSTLASHQSLQRK